MLVASSVTGMMVGVTTGLGVSVGEETISTVDSGNSSVGVDVTGAAQAVMQIQIKIRLRFIAQSIHFWVLRDGYGKRDDSYESLQ